MESHNQWGFLTGIFQFLEVAASVGGVLAALVLLILGQRLSKAKDLELTQLVRQALVSIKKIVDANSFIFYGTVAVLILQQSLNLIESATQASKLGSLSNYGAYLSFHSLGPIASLIVFGGTLNCQYLVFKENMIEDPSVDASIKTAKWRFIYLLTACAAAATAQVIGGIFFIIPGLIITNMVWFVGAVSISEHRAISALGRCFRLADKHFWDLAKIVMAFELVAAVLALIPVLIETYHGPPISLVIANSITTTLVFLVNVVTWQCQYDIYKYLLKSNEGEQNATATKISEPQT